MGKTREKSSTMMKRARYNQLELSNPNHSMFPEYLTTLPQRVEYYNIYIGPYCRGIAPAPPRRSVVDFGLGLIGPCPRLPPQISLFIQIGSQHKTFGSDHNSGPWKYIQKFKPPKITHTEAKKEKIEIKSLYYH